MYTFQDGELLTAQKLNDALAEVLNIATNAANAIASATNWQKVAAGKGDHTTRGIQIVTNGQIAFANAGNIAWEASHTGYVSRVLGYVPEGYRPATKVYGIASLGAAEGKAGRVELGTDGAIWVDIPSGTTVSKGNSIGISLMWEI